MVFSTEVLCVEIAHWTAESRDSKPTVLLILPTQNHSQHYVNFFTERLTRSVQRRSNCLDLMNGGCILFMNKTTSEISTRGHRGRLFRLLYERRNESASVWEEDFQWPGSIYHERFLPQPSSRFDRLDLDIL